MGIGPFEFYTEGRIISAVRAAGGSGRDDELNLVSDVNKFTLRPLDRDDFAAFTMDLCNNRIDAHYSRFPVDELESINEMVPGRPFMERHDTKGTLPRGTFFRSRLHEELERDYVSVRPDVYILRTEDNKDLIANIEGGVYRATSIGFSFMHPECSICHKDIRTCNHVPGRTYGEESCHYVMRDVVSVLEGSVVFSASQGTGFVAAVYRSAVAAFWRGMSDAKGTSDRRVRGGACGSGSAWYWREPALHRGAADRRGVRRSCGWGR